MWWEPSYLNSLLQEVLQGHCPSAEKRWILVNARHVLLQVLIYTVLYFHSLSVHVGDSPYQRTSIYSTGILSLRYEVRMM